MRRRDDDDRGENLAGLSPSAIGSGRRLDAVIPFPRRTDAAATGSAAGDTPPVSLASFEPLGEAVAAVVMRLRGGSVRLRVQSVVPTSGVGEQGRDDS